MRIARHHLRVGFLVVEPRRASLACRFRKWFPRPDRRLAVSARGSHVPCISCAGRPSAPEQCDRSRPTDGCPARSSRALRSSPGDDPGLSVHLEPLADLSRASITLERVLVAAPFLSLRLLSRFRPSPTGSRPLLIPRLRPLPARQLCYVSRSDVRTVLVVASQPPTSALSQTVFPTLAPHTGSMPFLSLPGAVRMHYDVLGSPSGSQTNVDPNKPILVVLCPFVR